MIAWQTFSFMVAIVLAMNLTSNAQHRLWKDTTGKFEVKATAVKYDGKSVYLSTENQRLLNVPLNKLSEVDQEYLSKERVLHSLNQMALFRYRNAYELVTNPKTAQEKAIYATLIGVNLTQYSVPEFDRIKANKLALEIQAELTNSEHPMDWYLIANLKYRIRATDHKFEKVDVELLKKASSAQVPYATNRLAVCYLDGIGVDQDEKRALKLFQSLVEKFNSPVGSYNVGVCHYQGRGTSKNQATAKIHFKKAAQLGMVLGISAMTRSFLDEVNAIKIPTNLPALQRRAQVDRNAARDLRNLDSELRKRKRLLESAIIWSQKLIEAKSSEGHFYLGLCHLQKAVQSENVQKKQGYVETAYQLFDQAAEKNHLQSVLMLLKKSIAENQLDRIEKLVEQLENIPLAGLDKNIAATVKSTLDEAKKKL